ncbi:MAG: DUF2177 domain-containing protein [Candidatus Pacebacteria bacterium CG10_big_fil_rev_8_21_14_0_10_36_11]|nr:MAG: DUF2177 domain-containing protein [Candidatus Pacebacteria bacterium CG10_big_fil_rev_8_21_14_0_10_36_11]
MYNTNHMKRGGIFAFFLTYILLLGIFGLIDALWLGLIARNFYAQELAGLLRADFLLVPGLLFYALHPFMLWFWGFYKNNSWKSLLLKTAVYGFGAYATYDLSNWATLRDWSEQVVLVDIIWGTVSSAGVSIAVWFIIKQNRLLEKKD